MQFTAPLPFGTSRVPNPFLLFLPVFVEESPAKRIHGTESEQGSKTATSRFLTHITTGVMRATGEQKDDESGSSPGLV